MLERGTECKRSVGVIRVSYSNGILEEGIWFRCAGRLSSFVTIKLASFSSKGRESKL